MDPSTPAFSSSSSNSISLSTTAQSGAVVPHDDTSKMSLSLSLSLEDMSKMSTEDLIIFLCLENMESERILHEHIQMGIALTCDFLVKAQAFHARQNRIVNRRPRKKRKQSLKVDSASASLPSPLPTNNLEVIEEAPPADAPPVKRCRRNN